MGSTQQLYSAVSPSAPLQGEGGPGSSVSMSVSSVSSSSSSLLSPAQPGLTATTPPRSVSLRSVTARTFSYLLGQSTFLALTNTAMRWTSPFTAVPVVSAVIDEVFQQAHEGPSSTAAALSRHSFTLLRTTCAALVAAMGYGAERPFMSSTQTTNVSDAMTPTNTIVAHFLYGTAAYGAWRVAHMLHRFFFRD